MSVKTSFSWQILAILVLLLFVADLASGSIAIPFPDIIKVLTGQPVTSAVHRDIILEFRLPKAVTCILAGAGLALSGLQMQTLFRNPLAGPDVLGLSSGASLAVSLIFMSSAAGSFFSPLPRLWSVALAASIGCALIFAIMLVIARKLRDNVSLLIVGLMVGAGTSSIVSILQYLSKAEEMQVYIIWTFGSLGGLNWDEIRVLTLVLVIGAVLSMALVKPMNAWLLGEEYAHTLGIKVRRTRLLIIVSTCLLTGAVTAFCGPIAFVGLAVPHLVKMVVPTSNHRTLVPAVILGGACLLLICDIVCQLPPDYILPVNAVTAMIGAPVVIWVILKKKSLRT